MTDATFTTGLDPGDIGAVLEVLRRCGNGEWECCVITREHCAALVAEVDRLRQGEKQEVK